MHIFKAARQCNIVGIEYVYFRFIDQETTINNDIIHFCLRTYNLIDSGEQNSFFFVSKFISNSLSKYATQESAYHATSCDVVQHVSKHYVVFVGFWNKEKSINLCFLKMFKLQNCFI